MTRRLLLGFLLIGLIASGLSAKVVRVEIEKREIILGGQQFGNSGQYEYLKGKVWIEIDPANHFNSRITDIHYAVKNENGMVVAVANFEVLQPADRSLSRGIALVEVSNRGGKSSLSYFNRARGGSNIDIENPDAFGDGLLMKQGLTIIWIGWQFDVQDNGTSLRLVAWVDSGKEPPVSAYPRIDNGTLISPENLRYPLIGGLRLPTTIHVACVADYGPRWSDGIIDYQPPLLTKPFPSMVSAVDILGNEIAGIRNIEVAVPLGTYLPWNLRTGSKGGSNELTDFTGTFVPLNTSKDNMQFIDTRPTVNQLYRDRNDFRSMVKKAADSLVSSGYLLEEDIDHVINNSLQRWDWIVKRSDQKENN